MEPFGTDEYIERVVREYGSMLLHIAYTVLGSAADAEDAAQDTFVRLMTAKPSFNDSEHEKAWLIRVVINVARNMRKSAARNTLPIEEDIPAQDNTAPTELLEVVMSMPERYSVVTHLYYYEGMSIKEIASVLRIPAATVGTRLARARAMLKKELEGNG